MAEEYLNNLSINPGSGHYQGVDFSKPMEKDYKDSPSKRAFAIPQSLSSASGGFEQQTFLGASIRNFSISAGYGDSASTMSIELVEDEFNVSDKTNLGLGADVYHNGVKDTFSPPFTGSPVFFGFGKEKVPSNEVYKKVYDDLYNLNYASETNASGQFHFTFGGILQSFVQNRGTGGNPLYSAQVTDPREILSNVVLILNNYSGTTFNNKNMFNLYGFLEYDPTDELRQTLNREYLYKDFFRKIVDTNTGKYSFDGYDMYSKNDPEVVDLSQTKFYDKNIHKKTFQEFPAVFPITGTGLSRRSSQGIPYYRIRQAINVLLGVNGQLPKEYVEAGFGGYINFRGFNYLVDLDGLLDKVPPYYFFDFDQMNLLDFCLEICDITSSDLFVSLLPIIEHPVSQRFYNYNQEKINEKKSQEIIAGIIRVDAIDRSFQPKYGAIKDYIDRLRSANIGVQNTDLGYELSNVVTDKFVAGAQEVEMYYFSSNADRDTLEVRKQQAGQPNEANAHLARQWDMEESLKQQILPFYGFLDNGVASVPKGYGAYQQILIDSSAWEVNGVGNYYVATEMELRAAIISYEMWSNFLIGYNDLYMESVEADDDLEGAALAGSPPNGWPSTLPALSNNFAVTVPRSVFTSSDNSFGPDGLPNSPCNPPYGYPLYYKRCTKLGVQGAGLTEISSITTRIVTSLAELKGAIASGANWQEIINTVWQEIENSILGPITDIEQSYIDFIRGLINNPNSDLLGLIDEFADGLAPTVNITQRMARKTEENARKVYDYIKRVADENLGKKFLVKIPREVNLAYDKKILLEDNNIFVSEYKQGPFGFRPIPVNNDKSFASSPAYKQLIKNSQLAIQEAFGTNMMKGFLTRILPNPNTFKGALTSSFNPITEKYNFNYQPDKQGGYVEFDLLSNIVNAKYNLAISQGLVPQDMTNFINENSRISCYARFDNSQDLSFDLISKDSFTQQVAVAGNFIPDVTDILDNTKIEENKFQRFPNTTSLTNNTPRPKSIAFVKCDVDENLYLLPPSAMQTIDVYGGKVRDIGKYSIPRKVFSTQTCSYQASFRYYEPHFIPNPVVSSTVNRLDYVRDSNGKIITKVDLLNVEHVYALITLPSRVIPIGDARFRDGMFQQKNASYIKHFLTMDVVRLPEFNAPAFLNGPQTSLLNNPRFRSVIDPGALGSAISAFKKSLDNLDTALPFRINQALPSPVYPDLVAIPLQSKERCYGPWVSCNLNGATNNIGGKVEFIKDENLAPWNFNGYDLMNNAGVLQAELSNSLLLSSERGGIVYSEAPSGISIGKFLQDSGPLVTNVTVDVKEDSISTTLKMDLYTANFGKLQKQKQDMISNISRERQKLKDEKNALIRKGFGKNQKSTNYNMIYDQISSQMSSSLNRTPSAFSFMTGFASSRPNNYTVDGSFGAGPSDDNTSLSYSASVGSSEDAINVLNESPDSVAAADLHYRTAQSNVSDMYLPASMDPDHPHMSSREDGFVDSKQDFYSDVDGFDDNGLTINY
jgi:hypothetical protein